MRVTVLAALAALTVMGCEDEAAVAEREAAAKAEAATLAAAPGGGVAPAGDFQTGEAVVRALYATPTMPTRPADIRGFFAEALVPGLSAPEAAAFDYRVDGWDGRADGLRVEEISGGPTGSVVVSHFTRAGAARTITWTVCRQPTGALRIVDARFAGAGDAPPWTLRQRLDLPKQPDAC